MLKRFISKYFVESALVLVLTILCMVSFIFARQYERANKNDENIIYTSEEILPNNTTPVVKEEKNEISVIRPYDSKDIKVVKKYYDSTSKEDQTDAIIYYEGTYIQNKGTDYAGSNNFSVLAIADGDVLSVTTDDIVGTTVKIKHSNNLISVYQSLSEANVKEKDHINQGEVIGKSGTNEMCKDLNDHLHFELYVNNVTVNPESYFNNNIKEN